MSKQTKLLLGLIVIFVVVTGILSAVNINRIQGLDQEKLTIVAGSQSKEITLGELKELPATSFTAELRSTSQPNQTITFTGISIKDLLEYLKIDVTFSEVAFSSLDGFTTVLSVDEVMMDDNVYVVYKRDNEPILSKSDGGTGPMEIIVAQDPFSNRWNKYVIKIELLP